MPMNYSLPLDPFYACGFVFMGPVPPSSGYTHILVAIGYAPKWVEAIPTKSVDHVGAMKMLKYIILIHEICVPRFLMTNGGYVFFYQGSLGKL
jgi:hypothetical protein